MRDRLGAFGGELTVTSALGSGTTIRGTLPVRPLTVPVDATPAAVAPAVDPGPGSNGHAHVSPTSAQK